MDKPCSLDKVAVLNGFITDKTMHGHGYTKLYERYFGELRDEPIKLLEIGLAAGHSAQMWRKYFTTGQIYTLDVDLNTNQYSQTNGLTFLQGSQTDTELLKKINLECGPFDIIIDDASHIGENTKITFDCLFPLLKKGGYFVVEDLQTSYALNNSRVFMETVKQLIDNVMAHGCCVCGPGNFQHCLSVGGTPICDHSKLEDMDKVIEFVHVYKNIVFIKKY
jgi:hypothetical protein